MSFTVTGLAPDSFAELFDLDGPALEARGACRVTADRPDAFPCRIGLRRAEEGEELLLVHHVHQPRETSPYRAGGPVFVARSSRERARVHGELAPMLRDRLLSLRAYDDRAFIVDAAVGENMDAESAIARMLADPGTAYLHAHYAGRGCYAALIERG